MTAAKPNSTKRRSYLGIAILWAICVSAIAAREVRAQHDGVEVVNGGR